MSNTRRKSLLYSYAEPANSSNDVAESRVSTQNQQQASTPIPPIEAEITQIEPSGVAILAVIDPPGDGAVPGSPGRCHFAPGLTQAQRREILFDLEFFEVRCRNREAAAKAAAAAEAAVDGADEYTEAEVSDYLDNFYPAESALTSSPEGA